MIEERALVTETEQGYVWLEIQRQSACGSCHTQQSCGTAAVAKLWGGKAIRLRVRSDLPLQRGDEVWVGIAEKSLLRGALLVYLMPLLLLFAGALLGQATFAVAGEELVVLTGAAGLLLGLLMVRALARRTAEDVRYQPVILRRTTVPLCSVLSAAQ